MRHLRRAGDDQLVEPRIPFRQHAAALDRRHALPRGAQRADHLGGGDGVEVGQILLPPGLEEGVVRPVLMDQRCAGGAGRQHVGDGRQRLEFQLAGGDQVLGLGPRRRDAGGDGLADMAQLVARQRRLFRMAEAGQGGVRADRADLRQVGRGEDAVLGAGRLGDADQPRMRDGAAQEGDFQRARRADIADIAAAAVQEARILLAAEAGADAFSARPSAVACGAPRIGRAHAASANTGRGSTSESASKRRPARRQKAGRRKRSAVTTVPSLSSSRKRPRSSCRTLISASRPRPQRADLAFHPQHRRAMRADHRHHLFQGQAQRQHAGHRRGQREVLPAGEQMISALSGCVSGVPRGFGKVVL